MSISDWAMLGAPTTIIASIFDKTWIIAGRLVPSYDLNWSVLNYEPYSP